MLLAIGVAGGKEKTDQSELSTSAAAIVARRVEIAAMVSQPCYADRDMVRVSHEREQVECCPFDKGLERIRQL